jgi:hypothetical protein
MLYLIIETTNLKATSSTELLTLKKQMNIQSFTEPKEPMNYKSKPTNKTNTKPKDKRKDFSDQRAQKRQEQGAI